MHFTYNTVLPTILPFFIFIFTQIVLSSSHTLHEIHQDIIIKVVSVLSQNYSVGLVLTSFNKGEHEASSNFVNGGIIGSLMIPYVSIDYQSTANITIRKRCFKVSHSKPYFVHVNTREASDDWNFPENPSNQLRRKFYLQLLGYPEALLQDSQDAIALSSHSTSLQERLLFKDFFMFIGLHNLSYFTSKEHINKQAFPFLINAGVIPRNFIWVLLNPNQFNSFDDVMHTKLTRENNFVLQPVENSTFNLSRNITEGCPFRHIFLNCLAKNVEFYFNAESDTLANLICPLCTKQAISEYDSEYINIGQIFTPFGLIIYELAITLNNSAQLYLPHSVNLEPISKPKMVKNSFIGSTRGSIYNSLVFIAQRPSSTESISNESLDPFTLGSWLGIAFAYAIIAIVFGIVKALTYNNLDESLNEFIMNHLFNFIDNKTNLSRQKLVNSERTGTGDYVHADDDDKMPVPAINPSTSDILDIQCRSTMKIEIDNRERNYDKELNDARHGRTSKAILHGTIRIVSFVLIAMYEGTLYNAITFPKLRLASTFEELVTSEKYSVKVTREAEINSVHLGIQFKRFNKNESRTTTTFYNDNYKEHTSRKHSQIETTFANRMMDRSLSLEKLNDGQKAGVNIEDCINWVDSSPDSNHACVGYEFELRNLHKTQRFEKLIAKSNRKMFKYNRMGSYAINRMRPRRFPGLFHISKWILESGIMQFWNLAEGSFSECIQSGTLSHLAGLTIKDYVGLLLFYCILLFISFVIFLIEFGSYWLLKFFKMSSVREYCNYVKLIGSQVLEFILRHLKGGCKSLLQPRTRRRRNHGRQINQC